ncbi:FAD/NAD(P)-binding domain-containing protein [Hypoxylon rubiginosum]|uniref:FAD/NAD(P)-binding domain-containing protein n=1 Tax=Hypoxylon rubiginosum TaxID=110542 RepID=A0ACB9YWR3_9PEZI|nr:FAD/NAD(P)-binding domain-containing protein [Hypoxylon rubiginosum]
MYIQALWTTGSDSTDPNTDLASIGPDDTLYRDVVVIGGGSSGTYTAVRLGDYNKTVAIVEKKDFLGGHAETYVDPNTGYTIDIGVINTSEYVDFSTGKTLNYTPPSSEAFDTALSFVAKYNLSDMVPQTFITNQGYVPILNISMLYMIKYLNSDQINSFVQGFLTTSHHNTQELYQKVTAFLGSDVLLNSTVLSMNRSGNGPVQVLVQTPAGRKLIIAKKLVSTPPPRLASLGGYDLSEDETALFSQLSANGYYTGILNNTGFTGLTQVYYGSPAVLPEEDVKADILATVKRIQEARGISTENTPDWLAFSSHVPFNLMVSNDAIRDGFLKKLFALQGRRHTFYNGAAWHTQDSSVLWRFTEDYVLPIILASL